MKRIMRITVFLSISLLILSCGIPYAATVPSTQGSVTFQVFYDELGPYGSWVNYGSYGYVWVPSIGAGFVPYSSGGHWVYTDYGWTWASSYNWGWAPFHYGRWLYDDFYGWMWVPGYEWAPAWVVWGYYDNYYGWAPIAPGITVIAGYRPPSHYWHYCPPRYITHVNVHRYIVTDGIPHDRVDIIDNYSNRNYHYGPRREAVEKASGKPVTRVAVVERNSPAPTKVSGNNLEVYRPEITKGSATPSRVSKLEEVKPVNKGKENINVQDRNDDPVYYRGDEPPADKKEKMTPQQKNPPVQERGNTIEKKEKITPEQKMNPSVEDRDMQKSLPPSQERGGAIDKQEKIDPQQKSTPPVQERDIDPVPVPQDRGGNMGKKEKMTPQQKTNPPVQDRKQSPPPQKQQPPPSQKKQKTAPR